MVLTGVPVRLTGTQGLLQFWQSRAQAEERAGKLHELQSIQERLIIEREGLSEDENVQRQEIRRVLGYLAPDESLLEFVGTDE